MLIRWSDPAAEDLQNILNYFITENDEETGQYIVTRLFHSVDRLADFPYSGRLGEVKGTRELVPKGLPYLLIYHIPTDKYVEILAVIHTSRLREKKD